MDDSQLMTSESRIRQTNNRRSQGNKQFIVTVSPDIPNQQPFSFRLNTRVLKMLLFGVMSLLICLLTVSFFSYRNFTQFQKLRTLNQDLYFALDSQEQTLLDKAMTVSELEEVVKRLSEITSSKQSLELRLSEKELALEASKATVAESNAVIGQFLSQLEGIENLVQELQLAANFEIADIPALAEVTQAAGGAEELTSMEVLAQNIEEMITEAKLNLNGLSVSISEFKDDLVYKQALVEATPQIWPVAGYISSTFGWRKSPISGNDNFHKGTDIVAPYKTPIRAVSAGKIVTAGWSNSGYGNHIVIDHGFGIKTLYGHLNSILVNVGDSVSLGSEIGLLGNTGYSTGPHLHYEVWVDDVQMNPANYLP